MKKEHRLFRGLTWFEWLILTIVIIVCLWLIESLARDGNGRATDNFRQSQLIETLFQGWLS
jgi:hypothetical protein